MGVLRLETIDGEFPAETPVIRRVRESFARGSGHGLLRLGMDEVGTSLSPSLSFWRHFAMRFLAALCAQGDPDASEKPLPPPLEPDALGTILDEAPPMPGAEYLRAGVIESLWRSIFDALLNEQRESGLSFEEFLKSRDSPWRLVGRVHFNLAENRKDADYPFAFLATYTPALAVHGALRHQPLSAALKEFAAARDKKKLLRLLEPVSRAGADCPWLRKIIDSGEIYHPLRWTPADAIQFLKSADSLERAGVVLRMPATWRMNQAPRPKVEARIGTTAPSAIGMNALLDFKIDVSLDGERLTSAEVEALLKVTDGLALLRGKWVEVDRDRLVTTLDQLRAIERTAKKEGLSFAQAMRMLSSAMPTGAPTQHADAAQWHRVVAGPWLAETLTHCRSPKTLSADDLGAALRTQLRDYQKIGVGWLSFLSQLGLGACLADDMGLGKTIQILAFLLTQTRREGSPPSLLVAPASLLANWASEAARFAPTLRVRIAHPAFTPPQQLKTAAADMLAQADLVVTSYGSLLRLDWLTQAHWRIVILDEAQAIKNPDARQTRATKNLRCESRIALTGTPIENNLRDLWSIFDFLNPGLLGSTKEFADLIKRLSAAEPVSYAPLRKLTAPYILRRLKTDKNVIADLPDKSEASAYCFLTRKQATLYQATVGEFEARLKKTDDSMARRGLILSTLMRLKQICNHPSQGLGESLYNSEESGKFTRLSEISDTIASRQEKVLVFTQFREIIPPLERLLAQVFGRPGLLLHGSTTLNKRREFVRQFQEDETIPFIILSLKAGGSGLNLTAASHVIHFDRWWNPAVENQATDRAFRIGQKRNVMVHKFICRGTIEEKIDQLIESKRNLSEELFSGGNEVNLSELSDAEVKKLVQLDLSAALREG